MTRAIPLLISATKLLLLTICFSLPNSALFGQTGCSFTHVVNTGTAVVPYVNGCGTTTLGSGTATAASVHNGGIYTFSFCGSGGNWAGWNSQMTGFTTGGTELFYNDDNGPVCSGLLSSAQWTANATATIYVGLNRFNCQGWQGSGAANSATLTYCCQGPGNPAVFGNNEWRVYVYNDGDGGSSTATNWNTSYSGYYTVSSLSFNTTSFYTPSQSPSSYSGYLGCDVMPTNHSWTAKRTNFSGCLYQIDIPPHDDFTEVLVNGVSIFTQGTGGGQANVWTGVLNSTSTVELRLSQGVGPTEGGITITPVTPPALNGGTIGSDQVLCNPADPALLTNSTSAFGGVGPSYVNGGNYTYSWRYNNCVGGAYTIIPGETGLTYDPPAGLTTTRCYERGVTDACGTTAYTVPVTVTVPPLPVISNVAITNVGCFGASTGGLTITATSGTGMYSYSIDNGVTFPNTTGVFNNLSAGNYDVVVRDSLGCWSAVVSVQIAQPTAVTAAVTHTDASCSGVYDGTITATAGGGTPPYTYSLNGGPPQTNNVFNGLAAGIYTAEVIDANGCTMTATDTISNSYVVTGTLDSTWNVSCFGASDGAAFVSLTGGISPYDFSINNITYQASSAFNGLTAGNYTIIARDSKGCTDFIPVTITQPAVVTVILDSAVNSLCAGSTTSGIYISVVGGTPNYSYLWNDIGNSTSQDLTNVSAGTYNVTVTDANGCTGTTGATVTQPLPLFVSVAQYSNVLCNGDSTGAIDITVNGGTPPYSFVWSNSTTMEDLANLLIGSYTVTVTDANGCQETLTQAITEPTPFTAVVTSTNATCSAGGTATVTPSGGVAPYDVMWSNGSTTNTISGLVAGGYTVTVTDANGCVRVGAVNITAPVPLVLSITPTDALCNGGTGSLDLTVTGGTGSPTFAWSPGGYTTEDISGVSAGTYTVTVTDGGCTATASGTVSQPSAVVLTGTAFDAACAGINSGSITQSITGGNGPYTFAWTPTLPANKDVQNLAPGTYSVTATDVNGCTATASYTINQPTPIVSSVAVTHVTCFGANNGSADLTVGGGTAPYSFLWSNFSATEDLTLLAGGMYAVIITDANGCTKRDSAIVNEPAPLSLSTQITNISCNNASDGAIDLTVSGGTPNYTYLWNDGTTTEDRTGLSQATYAVTVTDANGCTASTVINIINPPAININLVPVHPLCNIANGPNAAGRITGSVTGGTPGYSYQWSDFLSVGLPRNNVQPGCYTLTVTDSRGCVAVDSICIIEPDPMVYNVFRKDVSCNGAADGCLDITGYGGTTPYTFAWSSGQSTEDVCELTGGNYTVTITDRNACTVSGFFIITEPATLAVTLDKTDVACQGGNTGSVNATVTGGRTPYSYIWTGDPVPNPLSASQTNIGGGNYCVLITDSSGCQTSACITVNGQPNPIFVTPSVKQPTCYGGTDGFASVSIVGGEPPYMFNWSTSLPQVGNIATGLGAGAYTVTISDATGCSFTQVLTLVETPPIVVSANVMNQITCQTGADGVVIVRVTDGVSPFVYSLNGITQQSDTFRNVGAGTYGVAVRDANGCEGMTTITILPATGALSVSLTADREVALPTQETQLTATAISDEPIVRYIWEPSGAGFDYSRCSDTVACPNPTVRLITTTTIIVTAVNEAGCATTDTLRIEVENDVVYFFPTAFTPNGDGLNDRFEFDVLGVTEADVKIWNRWGEQVYHNPNQSNGFTGVDGWDGTFRGKKAQFDTYTYQIVLTFFDGKKETVAGTITILQ